jgi:bifunctional oligoribonuclease and PAP phosphatase NrnA
VVAHHPPGPDAVGEERVQDPTAGAAGELVYDMVALAGTGWSEEMALGVYVAIVSDTGSFRFSNTSPRIHAIAAHMLSIGVDGEDVFQRLYATFPKRRLALLREALATLESDAEHGIAWMTIPYETSQRLAVSGDDFEGLIEHARSLEGTRVALLFREVNPGQTKVSLRSSGDVDVNRIAREFGGGGHVKASGAMVAAEPEEAVGKVLEALRAAST